MIFSQDNRGLSLIEVIVAISIFTLIIGSVVNVFLFSFRSKDIVFEQLVTQQQGRKVLQDFVNEIRGSNYSSVGAYPLDTADTTQIVFYTNIDSDTLVERIRYFLTTSTIKKGVIKPTGSPLSYVSGNEVVTTMVESIANTTTFYYYDENYTSTSSPMIQPVSVSQVRLVEMRLTLERNPDRSPVPFSVQTKAELRNLKTN